MLFACLTFFALSLSIMFVFQVGLISTDRIQMQNAADAAAYSGALVEANSLNAIAQLNDGMAYLHYTLLRYVVDSTVVRTLESYERHHSWVQTQPGRFLQVGQGDGSITLSLFGDPVNGLRPGNSYGPGAENTRVYPWVMLGDPGEWSARQAHIQHLETLIGRGKTWLGDLRDAQRVIVAVTPRLVRDMAVTIGRGNGASHVSVSADLERAFQVGTTDDDGWMEMRGSSGGGTNALTQNMWTRYTERTLEVDGTTRPWPTWFDAPNGRTQDSPGYYQIRLCWNKNDWGHSRRPDQFHPGMGFPEDAPNGHWHCRHAHRVQADATIPVTISHGGIESGQELPCEANGFGGGHPADDTPLHSLAVDPFAQSHHAVVPCPTCAGQRNGPGTTWSDVKKGWRDATNQSGMNLGVTADFPRPIMPRASLLKSGVTVAAWRDSHAIGQIFPGSPWGMLGIATAQVGVFDDQDRVLLLQSLAQQTATYGGGRTIPVADASDPRSFFYSRDQNRGMRFGARLVPVAGKQGLSPWHPALVDNGLDQMIGPNPSRWANTGTVALEQPPARDWSALPAFLRVQSEAQLREAMWH